ncbi:MAG: alpha/beta hydrolase [Sphingomonadales bacterium]|nr:MAG: alpha/beta hydrolase [Sphingomonadales bacterium]
MLKAILIGAGLLAGLYLAVLLVLAFAQRSLIYPAPSPAVTNTPAGFVAVQLLTADGLTLTAAHKAGQPGKPVAIFFHGNGDSLSGAATATQALADSGYGLLLVEYRGYGGNPGKPSETGLYSDGRAAIGWLGTQGVPVNRIVLIGNSLGSGVATQLATEQPVAGLVIVSGYTSMADVIATHYPWVPVRLLLLDRYDNRSKLGRVAAPILILHGTADKLIPMVQAQALAHAAPRTALQLVEGAGHELAYGREAQVPIVRWLGALAAN